MITVSFHHSQKTLRIQLISEQSIFHFTLLTSFFYSRTTISSGFFVIQHPHFIGQVKYLRISLTTVKIQHILSQYKCRFYMFTSQFPSRIHPVRRPIPPTNRRNKQCSFTVKIKRSILTVSLYT